MPKNRYVSDYRLVHDVDKRGKLRTNLEYTGSHYRFAEGHAVVLKLSGRLLALCAVGWIGFIGAMLPDSACMRTLWVALPFVFCALPLAFTTASAWRLRFVPEIMEHRYADRFENRWPIASIALSVLSGASLLGGMITGLTHQEKRAENIAFITGAALVFATGCGCFKYRKRLLCRVIEQE